MTPEELESMLGRAREDDAYRRVAHDGYLARLASALDVLREKGVVRAKLPISGPTGEWVLHEVEFGPTPNGGTR